MIAARVGGIGLTPLLVVHILLLVSWLGVDVGVFYASLALRKPGLSAETRLVIMGIMRGLDRSARISLIVLVPVSIGLARVTGLGLTGVDETTMAWIFWALVIAAVGWVWAMLRAQAAEAVGETGPVYRSWQVVNWVVHVLVMLFFGVTAFASLVGLHEYWVHFVALKCAIFAVLVALGLWINVILKDIGPAFAELVGYETPERLARFDRAIRRGYVPVLLIYAGLVAIVIVSVARP